MPQSDVCAVLLPYSHLLSYFINLSTNADPISLSLFHLLLGKHSVLLSYSVLTPAVSGQKVLKDQTALLRQSPNHFATVVQTDTKNHMVELQVEGKKGTGRASS